MRVTTKGQITIPIEIREKFGIGPNTEMDFIADHDRIYLVKAKTGSPRNTFKKFRGIATVKMSTDEIMSLTRG